MVACFVHVPFFIINASLWKTLQVTLLFYLLYVSLLDETLN